VALLDIWPVEVEEINKKDEGFMMTSELARTMLVHQMLEVLQIQVLEDILALVLAKQGTGNAKLKGLC
jgi:hypothetical protein